MNHQRWVAMKSNYFPELKKNNQSNGKNIIVKDAIKNEWIITCHKDIPDDLLQKICFDIFSNISLSEAPYVLTVLISWSEPFRIRVEIIGSSKPSSNLHTIISGKDDIGRSFSMCMPLPDEKSFAAFNQKESFLSQNLHLILTKKEGAYKRLADFLSLGNLKPKKIWEFKIKLKDFEKSLVREIQYITDSQIKTYFQKMSSHLIEDLQTDISKAQADASEILWGSDEVRNFAIDKIREIACKKDVLEEVDKVFKRWGTPISQKIKIVLSQVLMRMEQEVQQ